MDDLSEAVANPVAKELRNLLCTPDFKVRLLYFSTPEQSHITKLMSADAKVKTKLL